MIPRKFEVGDVVRMIGGSVNMTVSAYVEPPYADERWVECRWFDVDARLRRAHFREDLLNLQAMRRTFGS